MDRPSIETQVADIEARLLDMERTLDRVRSIDAGGGKLRGDVTLSAGDGITLSQILQNIEIAAAALSLDYFVAYQPHVVSGGGGGVRGNPDWEGVSGTDTVLFGTLSPTIGGPGPDFLGLENATGGVYVPIGTWLIVFGNNPLDSPPLVGTNIPRIYSGPNPGDNPIYRVASLTATNVNHKSLAVSVAHFPSEARGIQVYVGQYNGGFGVQAPATFDDEENMGCTLLVLKLES